MCTWTEINAEDTSLSNVSEERVHMVLHLLVLSLCSLIPTMPQFVFTHSYHAT